MKKIFTTTIAIALMLSATGCGGSSAPAPSPSTSPSPTPKTTISPTVSPTTAALNLYGSTVVKNEVDNLKRADLWAIVPNADTLSENNIQECMRNIIKDYTSKNKVTAVTLYLADTAEDVERSSYTLGRCMYYPGGEISNALNTTAGDYSTFVFKYEVHSRADKETPTDHEIEIYDYVNSELDKNSDEDEVNEKAAAKYNISVDELNEIWVKVYTYKH